MEQVIFIGYFEMLDYTRLTIHRTRNNLRRLRAQLFTVTAIPNLQQLQANERRLSDVLVAQQLTFHGLVNTINDLPVFYPWKPGHINMLAEHLLRREIRVPEFVTAADRRRIISIAKRKNLLLGAAEAEEASAAAAAHGESDPVAHAQAEAALALVSMGQ